MRHVSTRYLTVWPPCTKNEPALSSCYRLRWNWFGMTVQTTMANQFSRARQTTTILTLVIMSVNIANNKLLNGKTVSCTSAR